MASLIDRVKGLIGRYKERARQYFIRLLLGHSLRYDVYGVSTWDVDCGIARFMKNLEDGLTHEDIITHVNRTYIAAINKDPHKEYHDIAQSLVITKDDPKSWTNVGETIGDMIYKRGHPAVVILQHEFGLDSDWENGSRSYHDLARKVRETAKAKGVKDEDLIILGYLHTVKEEPPDLEKDPILDLADVCDGLIVPIPYGKDIMEKDYGIDPTKIFHIDHGVREQTITENDRLTIKREIGLEDTVTLLSLGYQGPNKGFEQGIEAYARLVKHSFNEEAREKTIYLIAGDCHPDYSDAEEYQKRLREKCEQEGLIWGNAHYEPDGKKLVIRESNNEDVKQSGDPKKCDVVFIRGRVSEENYKRYLAASNVVVTPYSNRNQISSGILADAVGAGRVAVSTSFEHALYVLAQPNKNRDQVLEELKEKNGIYGLDHPDAPGVIVDITENYVELLTTALHSLISNNYLRIAKEQSAEARREPWLWRNSAASAVGVVDILRKRKMGIKGRGPSLELRKESRYA